MTHSPRVCIQERGEKEKLMFWEDVANGGE